MRNWIIFINNDRSLNWEKECVAFVPMSELNATVASRNWTVTANPLRSMSIQFMIPSMSSHLNSFSGIDIEMSWVDLVWLCWMERVCLYFSIWSINSNYSKGLILPWNTMFNEDYIITLLLNNTKNNTWILNNNFHFAALIYWTNDNETINFKLLIYRYFL